MYPTLYKGAGPGTHWHQTDARINGFTCAATRSVTVNAILSHITHYSHPSPLISFTTSFAVARDYAMFGSGGKATPKKPGYVYEVDLSHLSASTQIFVYNPIAELSSVGSGICHEHNGDSQLLAGVMGLQPSIITTQVVTPGGGMVVPTVTQTLRALVFAIRDAEILLEKVPASCVINRHDVS